MLTALRPFGRAGASDLLTAHAQPGVVVLLEKETRGGWRTIASAQVPAAGRVDFLVRPRVNTVFAAQIADRTHARSTPVKVTVEPELVARVQVVAGRWYVDVRSVGAAPGDRVRIVALEARPVVVTSGRVDRRGVARLVLHDASPKLHYRLELAATRSHPMVSIVLRVPHPTRKAAGRAER